MNSHVFRGSIAALVTPMKESGQIDYDCLTQLIDWHIQSGTHGLVIMGTTGESALVSKQELVETVAVAIKHSDKRIPIIAGCGGAATAEVLALVDSLNPLKPDGFLCVTPYYVKPSQAGLISHYRAVADCCEAPLILYNVPGRTACDLTNESVVALASHPNIIGIKDAVGDIPRATALFSELSDFLFFSGDDETAFDYMAQGGHGVISVTANVAPQVMSQWCQLLLDNGDKVQAKQLFDQLMPLHQKLFVEANPIPVKWALNQMKKIPGGIRLPLTQPDPSSEKEIMQALRESSVCNEYSLTSS